uniref:Ribosomal RNA-processing protein 40 n=1 Tax=Angiostrongylus cantonensis TaxID=6313 RepID=A0A0K0DA50_ANGCA
LTIIAKSVVIFIISSYGIVADPSSGSLIVRQPGAFRHDDDKCWINVHSKRYVAEKGDRVIGIVVGSVGDFYKLDIGTAEHATVFFLLFDFSLNSFVILISFILRSVQFHISFLAFEGATKRNRPDLKIGDIVYAQVSDEFSHTDVELTCIDALFRARGLGALSGGFLFKVSCNLARRLLSTQSQLLNLLGKHFKFEIAIGLNGRIWLKGPVHGDVSVLGSK